MLTAHCLCAIMCIEVIVTMNNDKEQDELLKRLSNYSGGKVKKSKPVPEKPKEDKDKKGGD